MREILFDIRAGRHLTFSYEAVQGFVGTSFPLVAEVDGERRVLGEGLVTEAQPLDPQDLRAHCLGARLRVEVPDDIGDLLSGPVDIGRYHARNATED
jgi:hypothetical protein